MDIRDVLAWCKANQGQIAQVYWPQPNALSFRYYVLFSSNKHFLVGIPPFEGHLSPVRSGIHSEKEMLEYKATKVYKSCEN